MYKRLLILMPSVLLSLLPVWGDDILMLKNGDEFPGKVLKISDKEIAFSAKSGGRFKQPAVDQTIPTGEVYMIKTEKRGTIFFINGQRIIRENVKSDRSADYIYLISGEEIPAWQVSLNNGIISYQKDKAQKRAMSNIGAFPVEEVFLVKYNDGSKDLFTDFDSIQVVEETDNNENAMLKVVFHEVLRGESLSDIADKYGVDVNKIKEWNELPDAFNSGTTLKAGTQLMLQVKQ